MSIFELPLEAMRGPLPATELPQLVARGLPPASDRRRSWLLGRRWGGYPELEWTFAIFTQRVRAFNGRVPALFYEPLTEFDVTRQLLRFAAHLIARGDETAPLVTLGFEYYDRAYRVGDGRLRLPENEEVFRGRHSVGAIDHEELTVIKFINSWGDQWGDSGYGYIDRQYYEAHVDEVMVSWPAVRGSSPAMSRCLRDYRTRRLPAEERYLHCWPTPNEYWSQRFRLAGVEHELLNWNVLSQETGRLVDVFELRSPLRIVARSHLHYAERSGIVKELFVPPELRRRGYGSILEDAMVGRCQGYGLPLIELWLHEADARPRLRPAAEAFASRCGYQWADALARRPNLVAVATKTIGG